MNVKLFFTLKTAITLCLLFLFMLTPIHGQDKDIYEITNNNVNKDRTQFYDLALKIHPTIYGDHGMIKKINGAGQIKKVVLQDVKSVEILKTENTKFKAVELIIIKLNSKTDLSKHIDLSNNVNFTNLKYIYVESCFDINPEDVISFIKINSNIRVFYKVALPS